MRVLLVEPAYRKVFLMKGSLTETNGMESLKPYGEDDTMWYPPLGLMKIARFHKDRGDEVHFVSGCDPKLFNEDFGNEAAYSSSGLWDRVYITTLFTFHFDKIVETINFYKEAVGGTKGKIWIGGVMASMMADDLFKQTGIYPVVGALKSPSQIGLEGDANIDHLPPDYSIVDPKMYGVRDTYYWYASRGCVMKCAWCAVPKIEPIFEPYFDVKPVIRRLREEFGDKSHLKLMDNNIMAAPTLQKTVEDLLELGYGKGMTVSGKKGRQRSIDFNQGMDATFFTEEKVKLVSQLNIRPVRIAFDRVTERKQYVQAVELAHKYGLLEFSNYLLYNWKDTPKDLYERIAINIELNEKMRKEEGGKGAIYSYPMRYAPIDEKRGSEANRRRDYVEEVPIESRSWAEDPAWTKRFVRNIEIMKGAANGAISPTPSLARRTVGDNFKEFIQNLYMPEELLRNRNKHERKSYASGRRDAPGTGKIEEFRFFISKLLESQDDRFKFFHAAVSDNSIRTARKALENCPDAEIKKWLELYLVK